MSLPPEPPPVSDEHEPDAGSDPHANVDGDARGERWRRVEPPDGQSAERDRGVFGVPPDAPPVTHGRHSSGADVPDASPVQPNGAHVPQHALAGAARAGSLPTATSEWSPEAGDDPGDSPYGSPGGAGSDQPRARRPKSRRPAGGIGTLDETLPPRERFMLALFGRRRLALGSTKRDRMWGWLGPLIVAAVAAAIRLVNLGFPHKLVFDETYYVKYAYSLMKVGYEAAWPQNANPAFEAGRTDTFLHQPDYVVHPPLGKWMISLGMDVFGGAGSAWAWRISTAVVGIIAVFLVARIARRLFASTAMGIVAGALMAIDGEAIVHSRTGLLDNFLMFWVLVGFWLLLLDRDQARRRLANKCAAIVEAGGTIGKYGPRLGWRWYRFAAAIALGLSCGVKWSGIYFLALFAVISVAWDATARRKVGVRRWWEDTLLVEAVPAFFIMVPTALLSYLATWAGWFINPNSYMRQWAVENPGQGVSWLPPALRSFWQYHLNMWDFHTHLDSPHDYAAKPLGWIVQARPTSFFWEQESRGQNGCTYDSCVRAITSIGNPFIWWFGAIAIVVTIVLVIWLKDWRGIAALSGIAAGWLPWFAYWDRTIFTFYTIVFTPWVIFTLVYVFTVALELTEHNLQLRKRVKVTIGVLLGVIGAASVFWYPIWTGMKVSYWFWHLHMWFQSWI